MILDLRSRTPSLWIPNGGGDASETQGAKIGNRLQPEDERSIVGWLLANQAKPSWQAKAMVHLPEQAITSRLIQTGTQ